MPKLDVGAESCRNQPFPTKKKLKSTIIPTNPGILSCYNFVSFTSVKAQRSFSEYKIVLTDRQTGFLQDNLEKNLTVMHNEKLL